MKKICLFIFCLVLGFVLLSRDSFALTLDMIGALATEGHTYPEWWYTGSNPTLSGTADANATVTIAIDGSEGSATADGSGNWSYSGNMTASDPAIVISSGGDSYSFTLHLGQNVPSDLGSSSGTTQSTSSVPETGSWQFITGVGASILIVLGWYLWDRRTTLRAFEDSVTRDLN